MTISITKDLLFDRYGDIRFNYGDIITIEEKGDIFYQNVIHRLITNFNDIKTDPSAGANLSSLIGQPVNSALEERVKNRIFYCLTIDKLLNKNEIEVITYPQNDKIFTRIYIYLDGIPGTLLATEKLTINSLFNPSSGLLYATI